MTTVLGKALQLNKWPHDDNASLIKFYGKPGTVTLLDFIPPWKMISAEGLHPIHMFKVHPKCIAAFTVVFNEVWVHCDHDQATIEKYHLHLFGGCFNPRMVRGSTTHWSNHAFACAIDINPDGAPMGVNKRPTQLMLPDFLVDAWKRQGGTWGGDYKSRKDWMHLGWCTE